jgi:hypothetical protein
VESSVGRYLTFVAQTMLLAIGVNAATHSLAVQSQCADTPLSSVSVREISNQAFELTDHRVRIHALLQPFGIEHDAVLFDTFPAGVGLPADILNGNASSTTARVQRQYERMCKRVRRVLGRTNQLLIDAVVVGRIRLEPGGTRFRCGNESPAEREVLNRLAQQMHPILEVETLESVRLVRVGGPTSHQHSPGPAPN